MTEFHSSHADAQKHYYADCGECHECIRQNALDQFRNPALPSAADLDAVAEEERIRELTNGQA